MWWMWTVLLLGKTLKCIHLLPCSCTGKGLKTKNWIPTTFYFSGFCRVNAKARAAADTWWCICKGMRPVKIECLNYGLQDSDSSRARTPHISNINPPCGVVSGRGMVTHRLRLWLRKWEVDEQMRNRHMACRLGEKRHGKWCNGKKSWDLYIRD